MVLFLNYLCENIKGKNTEQSILIKISPEELKKAIVDSIQEALQIFLKSKPYRIGDYPEPRSVNLNTICEMYGWKSRLSMDGCTIVQFHIRKQGNVFISMLPI